MNGPIRVVRQFDFRVIHEGWNYYRGVTLPIEVWARHIVTKVVETDQKGPDGRNVLSLVGANISRCRADESMRGPPSTGAVDPEKIRRALRVQVQLRTLKEVDNTYLVLDNPPKVIMVRAVVGGVHLMRGFYDQAGDPGVEVQISTVSPLPRDPFPGELDAIREDL